MLSSKTIIILNYSRLFTSSFREGKRESDVCRKRDPKSLLFQCKIMRQLKCLLRLLSVVEIFRKHCNTVIMLVNWLITSMIRQNWTPLSPITIINQMTVN